MSTGILKALMQLFAIIAGNDKKAEGSDMGREVVAIFLRQQLNKDLVHTYLSVYDEFVSQHHNKSASANTLHKKRTSLNSVKVLRICTKINEELAQKEKFFVLVRLIEFINAFEHTGEQGWEFVETVAETFNVSRPLYESLKLLVVSKENESIDYPDFLLVNNKLESQGEFVKTMTVEGLKGQFIFFRIEKENLFFLKYFGKEDLSLNGQAIGNDRCYVFVQGSSIRGSKISPIYYSDIIHRFMDDMENKRIIFRAENVSYYFKRNQKQGLHQLNIIEESGSLIGIMGGSGSGKSTLLNVLNGNYKPTYGKVTINGVDIHSESELIEGVVGYVAQDDLLIEELTVFQNLFYNAKLCFSGRSEAEIEEVVNNTLSSLGLLEAKDLKVGSPLDKTISGGQRKRLNIALELIREPSVLFVDEPTSGLSSRDSENIMDLLKELTLKGKLVFVVIHQPSSDIFKMFDKLFILDQGGYPIYYGNPVESIIHFKKLVNHVNLSESECTQCGNVNPEQIFNIIESKVVDEYGNLTPYRKITPREWNNFFNVIIGNHIREKIMKLDVPSSAFKKPKKIVQYTVFLIRDVLSKVSNKQYMLINFLEAPLLAFVLSFFIRYFDASGGAGYIFRESENIPQYLFISVIVSLFLGLTVSAEEIIRDQKMLKREKFLNLSTGGYLFSKISVMFFISAVQSFFYVLIGNGILGIEGMFWPFWLVLFSTSCFANILGLNISASFNTAKVIYILIPILIIPQLLFSGVIVKFDKLHPWFSSQSGVPLIGNIMASRWAYEAMAVYQFKNNEYERQFFQLEKQLYSYKWKKDFWVKEMKSRVLTAKKLIDKPEREEELREHLDLFSKELTKEMLDVKDFKATFVNDLTSERISVMILDDLDAELDRLYNYYKANYNRVTQELDAHKTVLSTPISRRDSLLALKDANFNESLEDFVTNRNDLKRIVAFKGQLVQKVDPIFLTPTHKSFFNAHFYAPSKRLFGKQITTLSANVLVIWGMTLLFGFMLFNDGLRLFIERISYVANNVWRRLNILWQKTWKKKA